MDGTGITRSAQVKRGMRATRRLKRPDGITQRQWPTVKDVLLAYASHLPNIEVSQPRVARACGRSLATVERATALAVKVGLIELQPAGHHRVNRVILSYLVSPHNEGLIGTPYGVPMIVPTEQPAAPRWATSTGVNPETLSPPPGGDEATGQTAAMSTIGEWPSDPVAKTVRGGSPRRASYQALKLARHFEARWQEIRAASYAGTDYVGVDTLGACSKWVERLFLAEDAKYHKTPQEVRDLIDAFLADVGQRVEPKEGHALWKIFATQWHRYSSAATVTRPSDRASAVYDSFRQEMEGIRADPT